VNAAPTTGDRIDPITIATTRGPLDVPDASGRPTLLLFYVESKTPLCARQLGAFEQDAEMLAEAGAVALAVSVDTFEQQQEFAGALDCRSLALAADPDGLLARRFGVFDEEARRAHRAAFVIGGDGTILAAEAWYNPSNSTQYAELFAALLPQMENGNG
jgi:peroxiredoxin